MIQDIAAHRIHAAQVAEIKPSMSESQFRLSLGVFSLAVTFSLIVLIQMTLGM